MPMKRQPDRAAQSASADDIQRILGGLDETKLLDILALRPTVNDLETASLWLAGDTDVFGAGDPLKGIAADVVDILTTDESDERRTRH